MKPLRQCFVDRLLDRPVEGQRQRAELSHVSNSTQRLGGLDAEPERRFEGVVRIANLLEGLTGAGQAFDADRLARSEMDGDPVLTDQRLGEDFLLHLPEEPDRDLARCIALAQ